MKIFAITTVDNPFNPFTQFDSWYRFDEDKGYHSCAYLARIARTSDSLSSAENQKEIEKNDIFEQIFGYVGKYGYFCTRIFL